MKQVQSIVGRWVQRVTGSARQQSTVRAAQRPVELDAQTLKQVAGGNSPQLPTKGW